MVTVVLTVYNRTHYITDAIESVLNQTYEAWEIIIADDSGYQLVKPIYELFQHDTRIRYIPNSPTLGIAASVASAIKQARGKYIAFLNDDDSWEPTFLEEMVGPMETNTSVVLAFSDHWIMEANSVINKQASAADTIHYHRHQLAAGFVYHPAAIILNHNSVPTAMAAIFRRDALTVACFDEAVTWAYDYWISCQLATTGRPFFYIPKRLTRYRVHGLSETARQSPLKSINLVYICAKLLTLHSMQPYKRQLRHLLSLAFYTVSKHRLQFGEANPARTLFVEACKSKLDYRYVAGYLLTWLPARLRVAIGIWVPLSSETV